MGFKRSEYRRQYKEPSWNDHIEHYRDKVSYRVFRRQLEHHHNFVEWDWDTESEDGRKAAERPQSHHVPSDEPRDGEVNGRGLDEGRVIAERGMTDREVQTPDWDGTGKASKRRQRVSGERRPQYQSVAAQQVSRPRTSPVRGQGSAAAKPLLLAFGWADSNRDIGGKKTFNIRALGHGDSSQVFPAALRSMRRNEYAIKYREEQRKRESQRWRRQRAALHVPPANDDDDMWMTEYQRNYAGQSQSR